VRLTLTEAEGFSLLSPDEWHSEAKLLDSELAQRHVDSEAYEFRIIALFRGRFYEQGVGTLILGWCEERVTQPTL